MNELLENFRMSHTGGFVLTDNDRKIIGIIGEKDSIAPLINALQLCISEFEACKANLVSVTLITDTSLGLTVELDNDGEIYQHPYELTITATY